MTDVVAEMLWHVATMKAEAGDIGRLGVVRALREEADMGGWVTMVMPAHVARRIACDLEELTMLRVVPPTGEAG